MDKKFDVLCIGSICSDLLIRPIDKRVFDEDATRVDEVKNMPGGDATNESIILAKLGVKVGLVGKVGGDIFGRAVLEHIKENRVNIENVKIDTSSKTGVSIVLINENGDRSFVGSKGERPKLSLEDIDMPILQSTRIVNIGSLFCLPLLDGEGIETIFKEAKKYNVITSADAMTDKQNLGLKGIKGVLENMDIFLPSFVEAKGLTGESNPAKMADKLLDCGVKTVVIKLGADGCYIRTAGEKGLFIEPFKTKVVDTTGAGDNFVAGFLTGVLKGWDMEKCGRFANAVGAVSVQETGASAAVKSFNQVIEFMESNEARQEEEALLKNLLA